MLQHDYIMRAIVQLAVAIREALQNNKGGVRDSQASRDQLEEVIGVAADMDSSILLSLSPESVASMLQLGATDSSVAEYIVHALMLDADYLEGDGYRELALLRRQQAIAITEAYDFPYAQDRLPALLNPTGAADEAERDRLEGAYL